MMLPKFCASFFECGFLAKPNLYHNLLCCSSNNIRCFLYDGHDHGHDSLLLFPSYLCCTQLSCFHHCPDKQHH